MISSLRKLTETLWFSDSVLVTLIGAVREQEALNEGPDFGIGNHVLTMSNGVEAAPLFLDGSG